MFPLLLEFGTAGKVEAFSLRQGSGLESKAKKGEGPIKVACDKNLKDHLNSCASDIRSCSKIKVATLWELNTKIIIALDTL
jgi:hypothetical protein